MTSMSMRDGGASWSRACLLCPLMLAVALAACGGDDGSGVDQDKSLSEVTDEEFTQICEWTFDLVSDADAIRFGCHVAALLVAGEDAAQCQELVDQCIAEAEAEEPPDLGELCAEAEGYPPCADEITVGQLERCSEAGADQLHDVAQDISCDGVLEDFTELEAPEACAAIEEACPDLFEDDDPSVTARRLDRLLAARRAGAL
jgi:hypothetical protein